ncbi:MAG TPA: neutral/alkaline non-lysosomal ceramidase N-terminal domain-containing protein [Dongiaceae bacterium]|nr:neutral/alkaline non-lysosomal ceramidase N-terminal domain-containing protein [Dongiaceae bacterium]
MRRFLKKLGYTLLLLVLLAVAGGAFTVWPFLMFPVTEITIQRPTSLPALPADTLLAGVAERDITPPIGIPKMGYSAWAREADGFRNRLKARAFYLKPAQGEPILLLQADLPASSLVLHHAVAQRIATHTDIGLHNLSLHVTHTHSGPGQYMDSDFYNAFGSNKPGFDPALFDFLVRQMADAVIAAYESRRPAKIAIGTAEIYGATKNRAMGAYVRNENVTDKREDAAAALQAVNPLITLVRIDARTDAGDYKPLGAFSSFAIHGTGIPPFTKPYHGDVWTFFERELEWNIARTYDTPWKPVHGPFEANHADNNPNYHQGQRGDSETRRIGLALAEKSWQLFQSLDDQLRDDLTITSAMREIDLLALRPQDENILCERAIAGTAVVGAAKGDEVFPISYLPPFQRGWPDDGDGDCHAEKRWMLSNLQAWGLTPSRYPHRVSITAFRIGDRVLVGLPFEITFEAGNRIGKTVLDALADALTDAPINTAEPVQQEPIQQVIVSSHTNGFFGYSATHEEYSAQWYEGGHTIYGPRTTEFLAKESAKLATELLRQPGYADLPQSWTFALASKSYYPPALVPSGSRVELQPPVFVDAQVNLEPYWETELLDVNPSVLDLHEPLLSIEVSDDGEVFSPLRDARNVPVNDQGYDLQILHEGASDAGMSRYRLRWFNPEIARPGRWFRFRVEARAGQAVFHSSRFH